MAKDVQVICVIPVRNESWILERCLACASMWADHIIVADQCSDDGSRDIARQNPKVTLIEYNSPVYDEPAIRKTLIDAARRIPGKRVIMGIDADEALTANCMETPEWQQILEAAPGTVLHFDLVNIHPDMRRCWIAPNFGMGFIDDGTEFETSKIHGPRIPVPAHHNKLYLKNIKYLHYQYTDWERMRSKHRWYQCWETLNFPEKTAVAIYRTYHHMDAIPAGQLVPLNPAWLENYEKRGIDMKAVSREAVYRWDREVLELFKEYGVKRFKKLAIWDDIDWPAVCDSTPQYTISRESVKDPRSFREKALHSWLSKTQPISRKIPVRLVDRVLRLIFR